jgi:hypothetical protein
MRKLKTLKIRGVQRKNKNKGKNTRFVNWKAYFSSCYFFITPFHFHLHLKDN